MHLTYSFSCPELSQREWERVVRAAPHLRLEAAPDSPAAALERYFARLQPKKAPDPKALPALSGLTRTAYPARRGPGWCDE